MQETECVLCASSSSHPVLEENGYTGRQCGECGLIFVSPRPSREEIARRYEAGDAYLTPEEFLRTPDSRAATGHARRTVKLMRKHVSRGSLLELGPGSGTFLAAARDRGFDVCGVELNPVQAEFIRSRRGVRCVDSIEVAAAEAAGGYDVVYHCDVLSHFYDPIEEFERIRALLSPGGWHVFETGNFADVDRRHFKHLKSFQYPDHLFFYGTESVSRLLAKTGFEHVATYRYSTLPEWLLRSGVRRTLRRGTDHGAEAAGGGEPCAAAVRGPDSRSGLALREILDYGYQLTRYTVGALPARRSDPQTLIVFARRSRGSD